MGSRQMSTRTNWFRTNGSGLRLGQGNNRPGPICPRILLHSPKQNFLIYDISFSRSWRKDYFDLKLKINEVIPPITTH